MVRFSERIVYAGFVCISVAQRAGFFFTAALCHDVTAVILGLGIFVEGVRVTQLPNIVAFFATQLTYGDKRLENLHFMEAGLALSLILLFLYGEPDYSRAATTGPYAVGFKEFTTGSLSSDEI